MKKGDIVTLEGETMTKKKDNLQLLFHFDGVGTYTYKFSEDQRMYLDSACAFAIKYLEDKNPDNPNIQVFKELKTYFELR